MFMGLKYFSATVEHRHAQMYIDNSTGVANSDSMEVFKFTGSNKIAKVIWQCCIEYLLWISAEHIPGATTIDADRQTMLNSQDQKATSSYKASSFSRKESFICTVNTSVFTHSPPFCNIEYIQPVVSYDFALIPALKPSR